MGATSISNVKAQVKIDEPLTVTKHGDICLRKISLFF